MMAIEKQQRNISAVQEGINVNQKELNDSAKALVDAVLSKQKPNQDNVTVILISQEIDKVDIQKLLVSTM